MKPIRLAVISDIHVGIGARARDLCPEHDEGRKDKVDDNYAQKFFDFVKKNELAADYLVLPGDATHRAQPAEFQLASAFVIKAAEALSIKPSNIVFVPGNHDVDWEVLKLADPTGFRKSQRYDTVCHKDFAFSQIATNSEGDLYADPHFAVWTFDDLLVVGYNSSHDDEPGKSHHGLFSGKHREALRSKLQELPINREQLRLFLIHHHPLQYDDPTPEAADKSIIVNAEALHALLREFNFDILVHGHRHLPRFTTHSFNGSPEIAILCSGSFSVQIDTRWAGAVNNQFHLVTIDGRDELEHMIAGRVVSWSYYYARGWTPSDSLHDGIPHIEPFGTYIRPNKVADQVAQFIEAQLSVHGYTAWRTVTAHVPQLKHLRPDVVRRVLDDLKDQLGFERTTDDPDKIVLLRKGAT